MLWNRLLSRSCCFFGNWAWHWEHHPRCFSIILVLLLMCCCCALISYKFCRSTFDSFMPARNSNYYDENKYESGQPQHQQQQYGGGAYPMQPYPQQQAYQQPYPQSYPQQPAGGGYPQYPPNPRY